MSREAGLESNKGAEGVGLLPPYQIKISTHGHLHVAIVSGSGSEMRTAKGVGRKRPRPDRKADSSYVLVGRTEARSVWRRMLLLLHNGWSGPTCPQAGRYQAAPGRVPCHCLRSPG